MNRLKLRVVKVREGVGSAGYRVEDEDGRMLPVSKIEIVMEAKQPVKVTLHIVEIAMPDFIMIDEVFPALVPTVKETP